MKKFTKLMALILALLMVAGMLTACGEKTPAGSEPGKTVDPMTLQWGYAPPANSEDEKWHKHVGNLTNQYTNGVVSYEYYPGGALGNEKVALEGVIAGTIHQASISANVVATVMPEFNALCLPFVFDDVDHFFRVITSDEYYEKVNEVANKYGMQYLGEEFCAPRTLGTQTPVRTPADSNGQVLRVMDGTIYTDMMDLWGFGSSVVSYGETYTAIQQHVVDGLENSNDGNLAMKFYEVIECSTQTYHVFHGQLAFMNLDLWNSLGADNQAAIRKAWKETCEASVKELPALYEAQYNTMKEKGVEMIDPTDAERQQWIDATKPLYEKYRGVIGEEFYDWFMALVEAKR